MVHAFNHSTQRQKQAGNYEFKTSLVYIANFRPASYKVRP